MEVQDITKPAIIISENATFQEAIKVMVRDQTNSLLVVNDNGTLVGVVGMSDILDAIVPEYLDGDSIAAHFASSEMFSEAVTEARETLVKEFMSVDLSPVEVGDGLMAIAATAIANHRTHIPVVDSEYRPIGVISRRGVKHIVADALGIPDSN